ncbi:hypothetical protein GOV13_05130 [Candidatus Pacearchaeota archaeon]|nr:hypothetical protein [Candidatus Pacearchaeota archaeon]
MMEKDEKSFDELVQELVCSLCPYLSEEERESEEQRFKDYLDIVWDIYHENGGGFDCHE